MSVSALDCSPTLDGCERTRVTGLLLSSLSQTRVTNVAEGFRHLLAYPNRARQERTADTVPQPCRANPHCPPNAVRSWSQIGKTDKSLQRNQPKRQFSLFQWHICQRTAICIRISANSNVTAKLQLFNENSGDWRASFDPLTAVSASRQGGGPRRTSHVKRFPWLLLPARKQLFHLETSTITLARGPPRLSFVSTSEPRELRKLVASSLVTRA